MFIHHLNCGSMEPYFPRIRSVIYCLLVETNDGLVLVDTGFGVQDYTNPTKLMRLFTFMLRCPCDLEETAVKQVERLGFTREDVKHIVLTHLHLDHAGGLPDFPEAEVHVHEPEYQAAMHLSGFRGWGYISAHWAHKPKWAIHKSTGEEWFGLECIAVKEGLSPSVLLIPLPGHTRGHCGVAVETSGGWLLHCGDATFPFYHEDDPTQLVKSPPDWLVRWGLGPHTPRLQRLVEENGDQVQLICSHDPVSYSRSKGIGTQDQ
jgi:glyoxylase-like metal-dependent hydrolase (beta-lactamase superfamily II)